MHDEPWLIKNFEENRNRLEAVAFRMLGSKMGPKTQSKMSGSGSVKRTPVASTTSPVGSPRS